MLLGMIGRTEDALRTSELAVESTVRAKGALHRDSLSARASLLQTRVSRWQDSVHANDGAAPALAAEALQYAEALISDIRLSLGEGNRLLANALSAQGLLLNGLGRPAEALPVLSESLSISKTVFPPGHPSVLQCELNVGQNLFEAGDAEGGLEAFQRVCSVVTASGATDRTAAIAFHNKGYTLFQLERYEEAELALLEAHRRFEELFSPEHNRARHTAGALADLYEAWESRPDAAEEAKRWRALAGPGKEREGERNPEGETGR